MSILGTFTQHSFGSPSHSYQRRKRKGIQIGKEVKLSLFTDGMILYIQNPKGATRKLSELIHKFGKIAGYKINTQKPLAFLYTNSKRSERDLRKQSDLPRQQKE